MEILLKVFVANFLKFFPNVSEGEMLLFLTKSALNMVDLFSPLKVRFKTPWTLANHLHFTPITTGL